MLCSPQHQVRMPDLRHASLNAAVESTQVRKLSDDMLSGVGVRQ